MIRCRPAQPTERHPDRDHNRRFRAIASNASGTETKVSVPACGLSHQRVTTLRHTDPLGPERLHIVCTPANRAMSAEAPLRAAAVRDNRTGAGTFRFGRHGCQSSAVRRPGSPPRLGEVSPEQPRGGMPSPAPRRREPPRPDHCRPPPPCQRHGPACRHAQGPEQDHHRSGRDGRPNRGSRVQLSARTPSQLVHLYDGRV